MKARQASVVVKYNDKDITKTITDYIEGFSYVDNASGSADTVTLKLNNRSGKWSGSWIPVQGDSVKTIIKLTNWNKEGDNRKFDCGYFLIDDLSFSGSLGPVLDKVHEEIDEVMHEAQQAVVDDR